jgi:hypothetical protein
VNVRKNRGEVFSAINAALIATQMCGKHISAEVNQQLNSRGSGVFYGPLLNKQDLTRLQLQYKKLKLEGSQAYDRSKDYDTVVT